MNTELTNYVFVCKNELKSNLKNRNGLNITGNQNWSSKFSNKRRKKIVFRSKRGERSGLCWTNYILISTYFIRYATDLITWEIKIIIFSASRMIYFSHWFIGSGSTKSILMMSVQILSSKSTHRFLCEWCGFNFDHYLDFDCSIVVSNL